MIILEEYCWLVVLRFNATITAKVISWPMATQCVSWLSHTSTNTHFFLKPLTTFLTCFSRDGRRKHLGILASLKRKISEDMNGRIRHLTLPQANPGFYVSAVQVF